METSLVQNDVCAKILTAIPHAKPFRFVDEIVSLTSTSVHGRYLFREDEWFYAGHFPGAPITPGVILVECMAQIGVVALGLYLFQISGNPADDMLTVFTEAEASFFHPVPPGSRIDVRGELVFFRRGKIKTKVTATLKNGTTAAEAVLAGQGIPRRSM